MDPLDSARLNDILIAFHGRLHRDRSDQKELPLRGYLDLYPGFEEAIARAWFEARDTGSDPTIEIVKDPDQFGDYRLVRVLGRGGQGVVHEAIDTRLGRRVALKMLSSGFDTAAGELVRRFRREAEVTSRLDHPGICPVYEHGVHEGIPFIAMRFVEGESLATRIRNARNALTEGGEETAVLTIRELGSGESTFALDLDDGFASPDAPATQASDRSPVIEPASSGSSIRSGDQGRGEIAAVVVLVERAARALHVAHEAGITHRDIKPGNIMIAENGHPVILDFGLARGEFSDVTLTRTGELFGTLPYMAPEQLRDQQTGNDLRTDVYALGVTLYETLSLRRPFEAATQEALFQAILTRDPPSLRKLVPAVPRDLEVVAFTALEKDPERRYRSALEFAEELRRVLDKKPIVARPAGPLLRAVRWAQRNPALAASLFVILVLLVAGIIVQRVEASRANQEAARANHEAARATRRFNEARKLARSFLLEVYDEIVDLPGATRARELMVRTALEYLDGVRDEADGGMLRELAAGYKRIGDVQGNPYFANLGDHSGALASFEKTENLVARLGEQFPDDPSFVLGLVELRTTRGDVLGALGRVLESEIVLAAAVREARGLVERFERSPPSLRLLRDAAFSHAEVFLNLGRTADAAHACAEGFRAGEEVLSAVENGKKEAERWVLLRGTDIRAILAERQGRPGDALEHYGALLDAAREYAASGPRRLQVRRRIASTLLDRGRLLEDMQEPAKALEAYGEARGILSEFVEADPIDRRAQREFLHLRVITGRLLSAVGRSGDAVRELRAANELADRVLEADPGNLQLAISYGAVRGSLGASLFRVGLIKEAEVQIRNSLRLLRGRVPRDGSAGWMAVKRLGDGWLRLGNLCFQTERFAEAIPAFAEATAIYTDVVKLTDDDRMRSELANTYDAQGEAELTRAGPVAALAAFELSKSLREEIVARSPSNAVFRRNLSISHFNIGRVLVILGRREDALGPLRASLEIDRDLVAKNPGERDLQGNLALGEYKLGRTLMECERREEGLPLLVAAVDRVRKVIARDLDDHFAKDRAVPVLQALGVWQARLGAWSDSRDTTRELLDLLDDLTAANPKAWYLEERIICLARMSGLARRTGDREGAIAFLRKTLELVPADHRDRAMYEKRLKQLERN